MELIGIFWIWLIVILLVWGLPLLLIVNSSDVSRKEKAIWAFAVIFVSWFAWILFLFVAPIIPERRTY